jgi:hypothetical protein
MMRRLRFWLYGRFRQHPPTPCPGCGREVPLLFVVADQACCAQCASAAFQLTLGGRKARRQLGLR